MSAERIDYIRKFFETLAGDDEFIHSLLGCYVDPEKNDGFQLVKDKGFELYAEDVDALAALQVAGSTHFELRLAGGAYRFHTNSEGFYELFVDSSNGSIYVDGEAVTDPKLDADGSVVFSMTTGHHFHIQFQIPAIEGEKQPDMLSFMGTVQSDGASPERVLGERWFPWGNCFGSEPQGLGESAPLQDAPSATRIAVGQFRDQRGLQSYAVALDLIDTRRVGQSAIFTAALATTAKDHADLVLQGTNVLLTTGGGVIKGLASAGPWIKFVGSVLGGVGSLLSTAMNTLIVEASRDRMVEDVKAGKVDLTTVLKTKLDDNVNRPTRNQLRTKETFDLIKKNLKAEYVEWADAKLADEIFAKYRLYRLFWKNGFTEAYDKALNERFKEQVPESWLDSLIQNHIDERWVDEFAEDDLLREAKKLEEAERKRKEELAEIKDLDDAAKESRSKEIRERFEKEKHRINETKDRHDRDRKDIKERLEKEPLDKLRESIEKVAETERARVERKKHRRHESGK